MKKLKLIVFCLNVVLLCHWQPVQHGHCSEQNKPRVQNITTPDITKQQSESQEDRKDDETVSSEPPASTSKPSSQTDTGPDGELRPLETGLQEKSEKAERTTAETEMTPEAGDPVLVPDQAVPEPSVPPDQAVLESSVPPDQSGPESSTHPEQDASSLSSVLPVLPAVPGTASQATRVLDSLSSRTTPVSDLTPCPVADDSCPSASVSAVPSVAACDGGDSPPYDDVLASGLPMVLENASTPGAGKGTKGSLERSSQGTNASSRLDEQDVHVAMETDPGVPNRDVEDIPTFDEWKKIMMEVENEKSQTTHTSCNGGASSVKKVQKTTNYASVECGAKILSSNPEAKSTSAILMENMDVYMLNPCSNKIWFVIELCQPIQLKQLDIANFELFSSTPKDFLVSISDRYPTSKWAKLGMFHARDERTIQSFPLDEHLYAKYVKMFTKYIKVELLSHFGSEHFCPLSLIRVFGTSMMEEYELNSEPSERLNFQDEDYDDPPRYAHSDDKTSKNLIGSAKDVILNMVNNIASNVLGGNPEDKSGGNYSSSDLNLTETSGSETTSSISTSIMLQTLTVDQHNLDEIIETPPITEDGDGDLAVAAPTISLSETPTAVLAAAESLNPEAPDEEQIITLLPKEEGEESEDQSEQQSGFIMQEEEQRVKAEGDRQVVRASVGCGELTPDSCSCVFSLQEHLLQKCFPAPPQRRKKETRETEQQSPSQPSMHLQETHMPVLVGISSSITRVLHTWTAEASSLLEASPTQTAIPPFPESSRKLEAGHLDLAPSLTSSLLDPASARTLSSRTSQTMGFLEPSANEPSDLQLPLQEQSQEKPRDVRKTSLLTSHSEPTSAPVLATKTDEGGHDQKPQSAVEKPSAEKDTQQPSVMTRAVDQAPLSPLSTPTDQSSSQPTTTRNAAATQTFTPMPVTTSSDGPRGEELLEEDQPGPLNPNEFYAEMLGTTDAPVHGSSQKESVFMRLNNRIKALEVNMSLSGRYLEQLSQRYRKQMEEMQKAFNKTIIKLQNTSRMAEEQDQKQTESIQVLQGQLDNVTQLLLNLSVRVSQLQREVSDRHGFLLLSILLCMILGLLVCTSVCRVTAETIPLTDADVPLHNTYSYCCPEASHGYEDVSPKRRASYPLTQSSLQIPPTEGPHEAYNVETQRNLTRTKKRKRKMKSGGRPETITPTLLSVPNGVLPHHSSPPRGSATQPSLSRGPGPPPSSPLGDPLSEGSSEASSQSDEPSFCGIAPCGRLCEGLPPPMSRSQRRCYKRRRSKAGGSVVEQLLQPERWKGPSVGPGPSPHGFTGGSTG